jgi:hypothetical protein
VHVQSCLTLCIRGVTYPQVLEPMQSLLQGRLHEVLAVAAYLTKCSKPACYAHTRCMASVAKGDLKPLAPIPESEYQRKVLPPWLHLCILR